MQSYSVLQLVQPLSRAFHRAGRGFEGTRARCSGCLPRSQGCFLEICCACRCARPAGAAPGTGPSITRAGASGGRPRSTSSGGCGPGSRPAVSARVQARSYRRCRATEQHPAIGTRDRCVPALEALCEPPVMPLRVQAAVATVFPIALPVVCIAQILDDFGACGFGANEVGVHIIHVEKNAC